MKNVPLDLYRCGRSFPEKVASKPFGILFVEVARSIASDRMNEAEERVLTRCLVIMINQLEYTRSIGFVPLPFSHTRTNYYGTDDDEVEFVANSIIATAKLYELQLGDATQRLLMAQGVEWAVSAIERGVISILIGNNPSGKLADGPEVPYLTLSYIEEWQESVRKAGAVN